jgi:hypothetical protein
VVKLNGGFVKNVMTRSLIKANIIDEEMFTIISDEEGNDDIFVLVL